MSLEEDLDFEELTDYLAGRLIYVIGNARGGSTLANSAIGIHPSILCVEWNDKTFSDFWFKLDEFDDDTLRTRLLSFGKYYDPEVAGAAIGEENLRRLNAHVTRVCRSRDLKSFFCLRGLLFWIMKGADLPLHNFSVWCVKANTWQGFFELKRQMPATKVVFVERDPRSTSLSLAKVYARKREQSFDDRDLIRGAIDWLRNATEFALRLDGSTDAHLLHFEQLVVDPAATLNSLYAKLGLEPLPVASFTPALAEVKYTTTKTLEEKGKMKNLAGLQTNALDRWRTQLTEEQTGWVCALTHPGALHYGYALGPSPRFADIVGAFRRAEPRMLAKFVAIYLYCRARLAMLIR